MEGLTEVLPSHYLYYNLNLHSLVTNLIHVCCLTHFDFVGWHDVQVKKILNQKSATGLFFVDL